MDQYSQQVLSTALRFLQDSQAAMDVHQEVFLEILKQWHRFDGNINWSRYLYCVTIRKAIKQIKAARKARHFADLELELISGDRPDISLAAKELRLKLAEHISQLPARQAEAFVLHRIEGLSYQETAKVLSCSESTVRVHIYRAFQCLSKQMRRYRDE